MVAMGTIAWLPAFPWAVGQDCLRPGGWEVFVRSKQPSTRSGKVTGETAGLGAGGAGLCSPSGGRAGLEVARVSLPRSGTRREGMEAGRKLPHKEDSVPHMDRIKVPGGAPL